MRVRRTVAGLVLTLILLGLVPSLVVTAQEAAPVEEYVWTVLEAGGQADILVYLKEQADLSGAVSLKTKEEKGRYVYEQLTALAERTQPALRAYLERSGLWYRAYWIQNVIWVQASEVAQVQALAHRPEVGHIDYFYPAYPDPVVVETASPAPQAIEWNILRVNADDVWYTLGITGTGAVVGDLDTGVQWDHPALINSYRGWDGSSADHNYNWWNGPNGSQVPIDYDNHGTHTMGTIVGDDGGSNQIGMAPGATWIACAGLSNNYSTPIDCFQFFLAPTDLNGENPRPELAPHVINNSWSSSTNYYPYIQALYAAGIFYAKSAGNEGPNCGTITNPGQWPEVTATAAFAQGDTIASFSSRGPVQIGHDTVMKPDIAAPGVAVRSSIPGDSYGSMSGTSMACPHVTGAVALLISARPDLAGQIDLLQMLLKQTAEPKIDPQCPPYVDHPNDVWGWGILDIYAAVQAAQGMGLGRIQGQVYDSNTLVPLPDTSLTFEDELTAWQLYTTTITDGLYARTLPAATYTITATHYGYLPGTVSGVVVSDGTTTTQDIPIDPAPIWQVTGVVTETQTGDPLAATILFEETPISVESDPATGAYTANVAQGTWWMQVSSPGHASEERLVAVDQDMAQNFSLPAIPNYYMKVGDGPCDPSFTWMDASGGQTVCISDDSYRYVYMNGRTFTFYGNTYNAFYVGSNGHVTFGQGWHKWSGPIPDPAMPNNGIYAFSTDLNPASCSQGTIYVDLLQDRYYVIEFDQVEHYPNGNPETFEIILDLETGEVRVLLLTVSDPGEVVLGVENPDGTEATQYAYDDPALITDSVAVSFYPAFGTPPPSGDLGNLAGTVTDAGSGAPIAGAWVEALAFSGGGLYSYVTGPNGTYSDTLCTDWYTMTAGAPGYWTATPVRATVLSGSLTIQDFALEQMPCDPITVADFAWSPITPTAWEEVTFTGWASGSAPISFTWDLGDGTLAQGMTLTHAYVAGGTYTVWMTATNCTDTASIVVSHTVTVGPCLPVTGTDFAWVPLTPTVGGVVTFTGWASGSVPITFDWDLGDGTPAQGAAVTHTYTATGTYTVELRATNCGGGSGDLVTHTLRVAACVPVELITVTTEISNCAVTLGAQVTGTAPITWRWEFGDGMTSTQEMPTHTYAASGTYSVTVRLWNCDGDGHVAYTFPVTVMCAYRIYLPLVTKAAP